MKKSQLLVISLMVLGLMQNACESSAKEDSSGSAETAADDEKAGVASQAGDDVEAPDLGALPTDAEIIAEAEAMSSATPALDNAVASAAASSLTARIADLQASFNLLKGKVKFTDLEISNIEAHFQAASAAMALFEQGGTSSKKRESYGRLMGVQARLSDAKLAHKANKEEVDAIDSFKSLVKSVQDACLPLPN